MAQCQLNFLSPELLESFSDVSVDSDLTINNNTSNEVPIMEDLHDVSLEDSEDDDENGNTLNETEISINDGNESSKKIKIPKVTAKDIVPGLSFSSKPGAVLALKRFFSKEFHRIV